MTKKTISILMSICVLLMSFAATHITAMAKDNDMAEIGLTDDETYPGYEYEYDIHNTDQGKVVWITALYTAQSDVVIPDTLGGYPVTAICDYAVRQRPKIENLTVGGNVSEIGSYAFAECESLKTVTIGDSVETIHPYAFKGCTALKNVFIGKSVNSIARPPFEGMAFEGCNALESVIVDERNMTYDSRDNCNAIIETKSNALFLGFVCSKIPDTVKRIDKYSFYKNGGLSYIHIPDGITSIGENAFAYCTGLTSITGGNSVSHIESSAFDHCAMYDNHSDGLIYIGKTLYTVKGDCPVTIVPDDGTLGIADYAFNHQDNIKTVSLPESVVRIGRSAFYSCSNLERIKMPESAVSVGRYAFTDTKLYDDEYNPDTDGVVYIDKTAYTLKTHQFFPDSEIAVKEGTKSIADFAIVGKNPYTIDAVTIPDSVIWIGDHAMTENRGLKSITIPSSVTHIGYHAFGYYGASKYDIVSPEEEIYKVEGFTIYGYTNSAAEKYAKENGFTFVSIGVMEVSILLGDADGNGEVDAVDATLIQRHVTRIKVPYEEAQLMNADVDGDGILTIVDATFIQRYSTNVVTPYPIGEAIA